MTGIVPLRASGLGDVPHGFLGRRGGVSSGAFASLNVGIGSGEDRAIIDENRRRAVAAVAPDFALATVYQVHSAECVTVHAPVAVEDRAEADAMVTDRPGLLLGILTADCAPVLFADSEAGVVGAAHAGWKGAKAGVTDATLVAMEALGARRDRIRAAVGPCIARANYEVDANFVDAFCADDPANDRFFAMGRRAGHHQFDLEAYVLARLAAAGVRAAEGLVEDTYAQDACFFSFRRATHRGQPAYGRQISLIGLPRR